MALDQLIRHLLTEVGLCGTEGASNAELLGYIKSFYEQENDSEGQNEDSGRCRMSQQIDNPFMATIWKWLCQHPDIYVRTEQRSRADASSQITAYEGYVAPHSASKVDPAITDHDPPSNGLVSLQQPESTPDQEVPRVYTSEEQTWIAVTGHRKDLNKVQQLDFTCLSVIASQRERGIVQPMLVKATGQDKRSLPSRTQRLYDAGYIVKIPATVNGGRTSILALKRFADSLRSLSSLPRRKKIKKALKEKISQEKMLQEKILQGKILQKNSDNAVRQNLEQSLREATQLMKASERISWHDLCQRLDLSQCTGDTWQFKEALQQLEILGCLDLRVSDLGSHTLGKWPIESVQHRREPTYMELQSVIDQAKCEVAEPAGLTGNDSSNLEAVETSGNRETRRNDNIPLIADANKEVVNSPAGHQIDSSDNVFPLWDPDRLLPNMIRDAVGRESKWGLTSQAIRERVVGRFYQKPIEHQMTRLVDFWQLSQPPQLNHLSLIRDTTQAGRTSMYIHYTRSQFQSLVDSGEAQWEAVHTVAKTPSASFDADPFGFLDLKNSTGFTAHCTLSSTQPRSMTSKSVTSMAIISPSLLTKPYRPFRSVPVADGSGEKLTTSRSNIWDRFRHIPRHGGKRSKTLGNSSLPGLGTVKKPRGRPRKNPAPNKHNDLEVLKGNVTLDVELPLVVEQQDHFNNRMTSQSQNGISVPCKTSSLNYKEKSEVDILGQPDLLGRQVRSSFNRPLFTVGSKKPQLEDSEPSLGYLPSILAHGTSSGCKPASMSTRGSLKGKQAESISHPGLARYMPSLSAHHGFYAPCSRYPRAFPPLGINQGPVEKDHSGAIIGPGYSHNRRHESTGGRREQLRGYRAGGENTIVSEVSALRFHRLERTKPPVRPSSNRIAEQNSDGENEEHRGISPPRRNIVILKLPKPVENYRFTSVLVPPPTKGQMESVPSGSKSKTASSRHLNPFIGDLNTLTNDDFFYGDSTTVPIDTKLSGPSLEGGTIQNPEEIKATEHTNSQHVSKRMRLSMDREIRVSSTEQNEPSVQDPLSRSTHEDGDISRESWMKADKTNLDRPNVGCMYNPDPPQAKKPLRSLKLKPSGGSVAAQRRQIIKEIVEKAGGIFPGDNELWYPFTTVWMSKSGGLKPDNRTIKIAKKSLVDSGKLRQISFSFQSKIGAPVVKTIISLPHISPEDERIKSLQNNIIAEDPRLYLPQGTDVSPALKSFRMKIEADPDSTNEQATMPNSSQDNMQTPYIYDPGLTDGQSKEEQAKWNGRRKDALPENFINNPNRGKDLPKMQRRKKKGSHVGLDLHIVPAADNTKPNRRDGSAVTSRSKIPGSDPELQLKSSLERQEINQSYLNNYFRSEPDTAVAAPRDMAEQEIDDLTQSRSQLAGDNLHLQRDQLKIRNSSERPFMTLNRSSEYQRTVHRVGKDISEADFLKSLDTGLLKPSKSPASNLANSSIISMPILPDADLTRVEHGIKRKRKAAGGAAKAQRLASMKPKRPVAPTADFHKTRESLHKRSKLQITEQVNQTFLDRVSLLVAVVIAKTIVGGPEQDVDLSIVATMLDSEYSGESVGNEWTRFLEPFSQCFGTIQREFQEKFGRSYMSGDIPSIDFENLKGYDWKLLHTWALENLDLTSLRVDSLHYQQESKQSLRVRKPPHCDLTHYHEAAGRSTVPRRHFILHRYAFVVPLSEERSCNLKLEPAAIAKSWVRANIMTPESCYDPIRSRNRLLSLGDEAINEAVRELLASKVISQENKAQLDDRRSYALSDVYRARLKTNLEVKQLQQAATFKTALDQSFEAGAEVVFSDDVNTGVVLAIINLVAENRIMLQQHGVPNNKFGLVENGYLTRKMDRAKINFGIRLLARGSYKTHEPSHGGPKVPHYIPVTGENGKPTTPLPLWCDMNGEVVPAMWELARAAVLGIIAFRPGITTEELQLTLKSSLEAYEITLVIEWLLAAGLAEKSEQGDVVKLREHWWMCQSIST